MNTVAATEMTKATTAPPRLDVPVPSSSSVVSTAPAPTPEPGGPGGPEGPGGAPGPGDREGHPVRRGCGGLGGGLWVPGSGRSRSGRTHEGEGVEEDDEKRTSLGRKNVEVMEPSPTSPFELPPSTTSTRRSGPRTCDIPRRMRSLPCVQSRNQPRVGGSQPEPIPPASSGPRRHHYSPASHFRVSLSTIIPPALQGIVASRTCENPRPS